MLSVILFVIPVFRNLSNKENGLSPLFIRIKPFL